MSETTMTDAEKLNRLADWFDSPSVWARHPEWSDGDEVQRDLRRIAQSLAAPEAVSEGGELPERSYLPSYCDRCGKKLITISGSKGGRGVMPCSHKPAPEEVSEDVRVVRKYLRGCRDLTSLQSEADAVGEAFAAIDRLESALKGGAEKREPALPFDASDVAMLREVAGKGSGHYVHLHGLAIRLEEALAGKQEQEAGKDEHARALGIKGVWDTTAESTCWLAPTSGKLHDLIEDAINDEAQARKERP